MAALGTFVAGRYTATWTKQGGSPLSLGIMRDGYMLSHRVLRERLNKSDAYGQTTIETFEQGLDVAISFIAHERLQAVVNAVYPWQTITPTGANTVTHPTVGTAGTDHCGQLILTVTAATPAAANGPATMTFPQVLLDDSFPVEVLMGPEHATIPFRGFVLPYSSSGIKFAAST